MRTVPDIAVAFVKKHEGCELTAYADSGGVWTIGYGHTDPSIKAGVTITQGRADGYLRGDLASAASKLAGVLHEDVLLSLTDHQYAALLSFVFNVGCDSSWRIWKRLNTRDFDAVPMELARFVNAGGVKVQGLVNRRAAEQALWATDEPGSIPDLPSSAVTRNVQTPPTPTGQPKTAPVVTAIVAACGTVPVAAQQVQAAISPYADHSDLVQHMVAILATMSAVAAVVLLGLNWWQHHRAKT